MYFNTWIVKIFKISYIYIFWLVGTPPPPPLTTVKKNLSEIQVLLKLKFICNNKTPSPMVTLKFGGHAKI